MADFHRKKSKSWTSGRRKMIAHWSDPGLWAPNHEATLLEEHDQCVLGARFNIKDL